MEEASTPTELPTVLVLHPSPVISLLEPKCSRKFHILKAYDSPLPLHHFLITPAASTASALIAPAYSAPITAQIIHSLPSLKFIAASSTGVDHVDLAACQLRGITVANASTAFAEDVADMAVGLFIDVMRKVSASNRYVKDGILWPSRGDYALGFKERRLELLDWETVGLGVAKRLEAFGCRVLYSSRSKRRSLSYGFYANVREFAAESDALVICCALTEETYRMINKEVLSALGSEGVIVNVGRGAIIDEKEMVRCLVGGEIAGAGLDVFENEPDVPKELYGLDNVVPSPHRVVSTPESISALGDVVVANLEEFFRSKPLFSPVSYD